MKKGMLFLYQSHLKSLACHSLFMAIMHGNAYPFQAERYEI